MVLDGGLRSAPNPWIVGHPCLSTLLPKAAFPWAAASPLQAAGRRACTTVRSLRQSARGVLRFPRTVFARILPFFAPVFVDVVEVLLGVLDGRHVSSFLFVDWLVSDYASLLPPRVLEVAMASSPPIAACLRGLQMRTRAKLVLEKRPGDRCKYSPFGEGDRGGRSKRIFARRVGSDGDGGRTASSPKKAGTSCPYDMQLPQRTLSNYVLLCEEGRFRGR